MCCSLLIIFFASLWPERKSRHFWENLLQLWDISRLWPRKWVICRKELRQPLMVPLRPFRQYTFRLMIIRIPVLSRHLPTLTLPSYWNALLLSREYIPRLILYLQAQEQWIPILLTANTIVLPWEYKRSFSVIKTCRILLQFLELMSFR